MFTFISVFKAFTDWIRNLSSQKRAQCGDVVAAIAAKDAQAEAAAATRDAQAAAVRAHPAHASRDNATQKMNPKATRCPELRGAITFSDGQKKIYCKECKHDVSYVGWGQHCSRQHPEKKWAYWGQDNKSPCKATIKKKRQGPA